ncbi:MAG: hypothetical protein ACRDOO_00480 [Actinomadura sp.]
MTTLATKLRDNKAVCAGAGAVDLAVEKLREVPERVTKLQGTARENAAKFQVNVKEFQDKVDAKDIPGAAVAYVSHLGTRVADVIDDLAERGKTVVSRFEPEVPEIEKPKAEQPRAKAATAKKGAQSAAKQTTAKKNDA